MRDVVVGTAGHIDHGKTLLVKALTGTDADRWEEEKRRGITMDIGFATLAAEQGTLHFVDLPGHERFIKNMLAGATGIDLCLLVVAADESVMPQTVEHAEILELLGVRRGVVALNKIDLVDAETRGIAQLELEEFLAAHGLGHLPVVPVSAATGEGVEALTEELFRQARACPPPPVDRPFRLPVDRVFPVKGFGTVVTGTCVDGALAVGEQVQLYPRGGSSRVRGLQIFGRSMERAAAGQRVAVNLPDLKHEDLRRGCLAASPGSVRPARLLTVRVRVLPSARIPLRSGVLCTLHVHTQELEAHLHVQARKELAPGEEGLAQLRMAEEVAAWPGDRFILRLPSPVRTVAGGEVLMVARRKCRWQRERDARSAAALAGGDRLAGLLIEAGPAGTDPEEAAARLGVTPPQLEIEARRAEASGGLVRWGEGRWWLDGSEAEAWLRRAEAWVKSKVQGGSPVTWVPRQELLGRWLRVLGADRGGDLVSALVAAGRLEAEGDRLRLAGYTAQLTPKQRQAAERVRTALASRENPVQTGRELEAAWGPDVRSVLPLLAGSGEVVRFGGDCFLASETLARLRDLLLAWSAGHQGAITVPEFKDLLGITRKYAMPLLEHLDDRKWTRREGEGRRILLKQEEVGGGRETHHQGTKAPR